ncbi:hypothetical protein [Bernardetia sp.]|uniref:hypothetical protein n=1 Tax=Bernardetia sp. TaxID=1937974 RepID=UPI0025B85179|nr:hypothetical protein [Bernardetia sp.]
MKRFSPYVSAGLVASMFYVLYQMRQAVDTMEIFATALHHTTVLLLFSTCGLMAILLSLSGFKSLDNGLQAVSYFGLIGSILILLSVWFMPFFV